MSRIHPTAVVDPAARIDPSADIGPFCVIGPDVEIGPGVRLASHVVVDGHTSIAEGTQLSPFCSVGLPPQDLKYKGEPTRTEIGPRCLIREHVTIHRGTATGRGITSVGAECMLMAVVHVAHDCALGNGVVVANNTVMGGHVQIHDHAVIGGAAAIHQFVRIGRGAMVGGVTGVGADLVPFGVVTGNRGKLTGINVIGMRRRGFDRATIHAVRAAYRDLFWSDGIFADRLAEVRAELGDDPLMAEVLAFIDSPSRRGLLSADRTGAEEGEL